MIFQPDSAPSSFHSDDSHRIIHPMPKNPFAGKSGYLNSHNVQDLHSFGVLPFHRSSYVPVTSNTLLMDYATSIHLMQFFLLLTIALFGASVKVCSAFLCLNLINLICHIPKIVRQLPSCHNDLRLLCLRVKQGLHILFCHHCMINHSQQLI